MTRFVNWLLLGLAGSLLVSCGSGSSVRPVSLVIVAFDVPNPVFVTNARDGSGRLFVVDQSGKILFYSQKSNEPSTYLDIRAKVAFAGDERGLLGVAFHPQFKTNRRFFVNYTRKPDNATVISEFKQSASDSDVADPIETVLLTIPQPDLNHKGGMLAFGPDGYLYIGMGDGGGANDPSNNAQNPMSLLGKMLRIDVNGARPYAIPADNPFFGSLSTRNEIWATGLRNPWRFSFDRASGILYIGDVGQDQYEEVDIGVKGANYGWRVMEGKHCTNNDPALCGNAGYTAPRFEYDHSGGRCAIIGGYAYRGTSGVLPAGAYVYGDYCSGEVWTLANSTATRILSTGSNITSFGEDESGELYVVAAQAGTIYRIIP